MRKFHRYIALSILATGAALYLAAPGEASAQSNGLSTICFRGRTVQVPTYLVSRYIAAGATAGACEITQTSN